jgi:hypothetical protein
MTDGIKDTIGCDLGDKFSDLFILTANGETQVPERLKTTQAGVKKFCTWIAPHTGHTTTAARFSA